MTIYYNDTDITASVRVKSCRFSEGGGRSDILELECYGTKVWDEWHPQEDDIIRAEHNGFDTGSLYVSSVMPEGDVYTILASSLPARARVREYRSYKDYTLKDLMSWFAGTFRMGAGLFGLSGDMRYGYLVQDNEGGAAALEKLLECEGARLKCTGGRLNAISLDYAFGLPAALTLSLAADQAGVSYRRCELNRLSSLTVKGTGVTGTAYDKDCKTGKTHTFALLQARTPDEARRWAKGLLLTNNLKSEVINIETSFNPYYTYLARTDVTGGSQMDGRYIITQATHDFIFNRSSAVLMRCREGIE